MPHQVYDEYYLIAFEYFIYEVAITFYECKDHKPTHKWYMDCVTFLCIMIKLLCLFIIFSITEVENERRSQSLKSVIKMKYDN